MSWEVRLSRPAQKSLRKAPKKDRAAISLALYEMASNPYSGDVKKLRDQYCAHRRRVGDWRIIFIPHQKQIQIVEVISIKRRTTTTY